MTTERLLQSLRRAREELAATREELRADHARLESVERDLAHLRAARAEDHALVARVLDQNDVLTGQLERAIDQSRRAIAHVERVAEEGGSPPRWAIVRAPSTFES